MLFRDLLALWLKEKKEEMIKLRTYRRYESSIYSQILPNLGDLETDEVTSEVLINFRKTRLESGNSASGKPLAQNTVRGIMSIISCAIEYAAEKGIPTADMRDLPPMRGGERRVSVFRKDEQKRIEKAVIEGGKPNHFGIILCLYTGLRLGELLGLSWSDIDFQAGTLTVNNTSCFIKGENGKYAVHVDIPKTESSIRTIPIPSRILSYLRTMQRKSKAEYVIATCRGDRVNNRAYQETYRRVLLAAGVAYKNFHVTRHTFATRALECGVDIKTLSELLGHKTPAITMNRYVHSLMETKRKAMNTLAKSLSFGEW